MFPSTHMPRTAVCAWESSSSADTRGAESIKLSGKKKSVASSSFLLGPPAKVRSSKIYGVWRPRRRKTMKTKWAQEIERCSHAAAVSNSGASDCFCVFLLLIMELKKITPKHNFYRETFLYYTPLGILHRGEMIFHYVISQISEARKTALKIKLISNCKNIWIALIGKHFSTAARCRNNVRQRN